DLDAVPKLDTARDEGLRLPSNSDVRLLRLGRPAVGADPLRRVARAVAIDVDAEHLPALLGEPLGRRPADPGRGPGDDARLGLDATHRSSFRGAGVCDPPYKPPPLGNDGCFSPRRRYRFAEVKPRTRRRRRLPRRRQPIA